MALIERLMHWGGGLGDTEPPDFEPQERWLSIHEFLAANMMVRAGALTVAQIKAFLATTTADDADYDALIALFNAEPAGTKHVLLHTFDSVFILAENRRQGFDTPGAVRSKLGI